jgi:hypothetical protein
MMPPSPETRRRLALRWGRRGLLVGGVGAAAIFGELKTRPPDAEADLHLLYTPAARHHGPDRNPIIVIPGLLGSRLRDLASGEIVWGAFEGTAADPGTVTGARLVALPFTDAMTTPGARVAADGVLDRVRIRVAGIPVGLRAYAEILSTLGVGGYRDSALGLAGQVQYGPDHFTCFQFAYDWRQDNVLNARRLMAFMREKRAEVQAEYARRYGMPRDAPVKFDIVAHSMGGLVARYALLHGGADLPADGSLPAPSFAGAEFMARLIQIGTPNGGSLDAFRVLVDGRDFGQPIVPRYRPAILGTFASVYQLLPRHHSHSVVSAEQGAPLDLHDPAVWQRMGWGLAAPGIDGDLATLLPDEASAAERRSLALALQARLLHRARAFAAAMDQEVTVPPGTELMLVVGDAMPTPARLAAQAGTGRLTVVRNAPGDGVVLRDSVLLDQRQGREPRPPALMSPMDMRRALFLPREHLAITRDPTFRDNILFWLLEERRRD